MEHANEAISVFNCSDGTFAVLVCSDVAARGIDFRNVSHVIQVHSVITSSLFIIASLPVHNMPCMSTVGPRPEQGGVSSPCRSHRARGPVRA
jgi:hypothetical protein